MNSGDLGYWTILIALIGGAVRVGTPFIFVSLGECLTERAGRINLGLEGTLVMGAMTGYALSFHTGSPWVGVLCAGLAGAAFGVLHGLLCSLKRVNDIAVGIGLMILGTGLAFFLGKPYVQPQAPMLPALGLGDWSSVPQVQSALRVNVLFIAGALLAVALDYGLKATRWGMLIRLTGDNEQAAWALGYPVTLIRIVTTAAGGFLAGVGGSFLSLYYPGSWNEGLSSGQGLMAVALVIFARWSPLRCFWASLLFGAAGALGPSLQSGGVTFGYHLFNAAPYVVTLLVMIVSCSPGRSLVGAPGELSLNRN